MAKRTHKECPYTASKVKEIDYLDIQNLQKHLTENGKIISGKASKTSAFYQRKVAVAVKRARYLSLIPYCDIHRLG